MRSTGETNCCCRGIRSGSFRVTGVNEAELGLTFLYSAQKAKKGTSAATMDPMIHNCSTLLKNNPATVSPSNL